MLLVTVWAGLGTPEARLTLPRETEARVCSCGSRIPPDGVYSFVCVYICQRTSYRLIGVGRKTAIAVFCGGGQLEGISMSCLRKSVTVWVQHLEARISCSLDSPVNSKTDGVPGWGLGINM